MSKFKRCVDSWARRHGVCYEYICLGCDQTHLVYVRPCMKEGVFAWKFNGDVDNPTLIPSVVFKVKFTVKDRPDIKCHHFIKAGMIQYLSDCTHEYAGRIIELPDWEETYGDK